MGDERVIGTRRAEHRGNADGANAYMFCRRAEDLKLPSVRLTVGHHLAE